MCASILNVNGTVCVYISSAVVKCSSELPVYELITPKSCTVAPRDFIHSPINFNVNSLYFVASTFNFFRK